MTAPSERQKGASAACVHDPVRLRVVEFKAAPERTATERLMFVPLPAPHQPWPSALERKPEVADARS